LLKVKINLVNKIGLESFFANSKTYLNRELTRWGQNDCRDFAATQNLVFAQVLRHRKGKSQSLARACQITGDDVLTIEDGVERVLLDWEQVLDSTLREQLRRL